MSKRPNQIHVDGSSRAVKGEGSIGSSVVSALLDNGGEVTQMTVNLANVFTLSGTK